MKIKNNIISVDKFINKAIYDKNFGYYTNKNPIGRAGDFITAPSISPLFSEMITIWIVSYWVHLKKPRTFSIVELGPGDGTFCKILCRVAKNFPDFEKSLQIFLFEKSEKLKKLQKKRINDKKVKWINNFNSVSSGPVLFFGNEFFDAIPIKQFKKFKNNICERFIKFKDGKFKNYLYRKIDKKTLNELKKLGLDQIKNIIEYPKEGLSIIKNINKKIKKFKGGLLLIDYGYLFPKGLDTLQSVRLHKINKIFDFIGSADITYNINFKLLKNFLTKEKLYVNKIVTQGYFLKKLGIIERAEILCKDVSFKEKSDMFYRLERLLSEKKMGGLFKVLFAASNKSKFNLGFN